MHELIRYFLKSLASLMLWCFSKYLVTLLSVLLIGAESDILSNELEKVPNFVLYDVKGNRNIFYNIMEKVPNSGIVIINLTSVYCIPCKKEIPELLQISMSAGKNVKLLIIYSEGRKLVKESALSLGVLKQAYTDPLKAIHKKFNVREVPVTYLIDRRCNVIGRFVGFTKENINRIKKIVKGI